MAKWSKDRVEANPAVYRETIVVMMRYGGCVDQIAKDLGMREKHVSGLYSVRGVGCGVREKVMALEICDGQEEEAWTGVA